MTPEQQLNFLNKVIGRKIRYSTWNSDVYIIIKQLNPVNYTWAIGELYKDNILLDSLKEVYVRNGFDPDRYGFKWEFVEESNITTSANITIDKKCTCSSRDLFNYGCKCGGK